MLREPRSIPYIENIPNYEVGFIETRLGTYSIFMKEGDLFVVQTSSHKDQDWNLKFDGASSSQGNGVGVIL